MENSQIKTVTIVVNTCDAYSDVLQIFFHALKEHWSDCPYPVVINTETANYNYLARTHHYLSKTGEDDWGARLRATLSTVETEFVMMLYDDFILEAPVDTETFDVALGLLRDDADAVVTYLIDTSLALDEPASTAPFIPLKPKAQYRLNSAPAIWRKQAIFDYTAAGDTPWAWEVFGTYRTWGDGKVFYSLNPNRQPVYAYNYSKGGAVYRGKWVREVVDAVATKYLLSIDWNVRGFSSDVVPEKRSFVWKLKFIKTGFAMVGLRALNFFTSYIKEKINDR